MTVSNIDLNKRVGEFIIDEVNKTVAVLKRHLSVQDPGVQAFPKQERFRATTRNHYKNARDIITVHDVADKESFNNVTV